MGIRDGEQILEMMRAYQVPCLLAAAADLDLFEKLAQAPRSAVEVAAAAGCDLRAVTILLDALAAVGVIVKQDERYFPRVAVTTNGTFPLNVPADIIWGSLNTNVRAWSSDRFFDFGSKHAMH